MFIMDFPAWKLYSHYIPLYDPWGWDQAPINHHYISINKPPVFTEAAPATPALLFGGPAV